MPAKTPGRAILVGAGPGDPDLLTLRAARALGAAELVLYDALVDPRVLALAPRAARFYVGKRAGRAAIAQSTIHALILRAVRRGKTVVRLKAGDPFVLGRGGEEALFCGDVGIPCEVIPGVTSAIAGPAAAGIPVTHRGVAPGVLVLSAVPDTHYRAILSRLPPGSVTVVLMMALGSRSSIASFLAGAGWPAELPAAIVLGATTPSQWSWTGTLADIGDAEVPDERRELPGLLVLGPVVSLSLAILTATPPARSTPHDRRHGHIPQEATPWPRMQVP
jgi:uroporphyrin-III C-methyltransferase